MSAAPVEARPGGSRRLRAAGVDPSGNSVYATIGKFGLPALLVVVLVVFGLARPHEFATWKNVQSTLDQESPVIIGAFGAMLPLLTGSFDLSVAANISLGNIILAASTTNHHVPLVLAILLTLAVCTLIGVINGLVVEKFQVNSFVATLGMATILQGLGLAYSHSADILTVPSGVTTLVEHEVLGVPLAIVYAGLIAIIIGVALRSLPVGRKLRAVGANRRAALLTGISPQKYVIASFALAGLLAGVAGVILTGQLGAATAAGTADSLLLPVFAAVFLGSTAFTPGRLNVIGTIVAALFLSFTSSGLVLVGAAQWESPIVNGAALILAVAISSWALRLRASRFRAEQLRALETAASSGDPP